MSLYTVKGKIEKDGKTYELRQTDATTVRRVEVESVTHQPPTQSPSDDKEQVLDTQDDVNSPQKYLKKISNKSKEEIDKHISAGLRKDEIKTLIELENKKSKPRKTVLTLLKKAAKK